MVFAFLLGMKSAQPETPGVADAAGSTVYSPLASVSTELIRESDVTLLVVEGLEPLDEGDLVIGESLEGESGYFVNTIEEIY